MSSRSRWRKKNKDEYAIIQSFINENQDRSKSPSPADLDNYGKEDDDAQSKSPH